MSSYEEIKNTITAIAAGTNGVLDILLQVEKIIDDSGIYVYPNWESGEIVDGPQIERHWVEITLMYPYKKMPEPVGALRLTKLGAKVYFEKDVYEEPRRVSGPKDIADPVTQLAKLEKHQVWLIKIRVPKHLVDQGIENFTNLEDIEYDVDTDDIDEAYRTEGDETQGGDAENADIDNEFGSLDDEFGDGTEDDGF